MATTKAAEDRKKELEPQLVIAIDFGTTGTGYAFQTRADFRSDKLTMYENLNREEERLDCKIPTCLLVSPDKTFISFGEDAEYQYCNLRPEENPKTWFFFRNFKMQIYGKETITGDMELRSENGNTLPALFVFSESIKWIRKNLLETLEMSKCRYLEETTKWVLTVPAIWTEDAKNLMRESAQKAGVKPKNLCIALEPEVAAVYYATAEANPPNESKRDFDKSIWTGPDTTNIIVDMGGGTVDITTVEIQKDGTMKQIHVAVGGPMGGNKVDEKFFRYMSEILGPSVWTKFIRECPSNFYDFRISFERAKRQLQAKLRHEGVKDEFQIVIPNSVKKAIERENGKKINEVLAKNEKTKDKVEFIYGKLVFKGEILRAMMKESLDEITEYITEVANDVKQLGRRIHAVILVGGFASSKFMTTEIKSALEGKLGIIVKRPPFCHLAVLRGAVLYGQNENILISRVVRMTYGIGATVPSPLFPKKKTEEMFQIDGRWYVNGVFIPHVIRGQEVRIDEWITGDEYFPLEKDQKEIEIHIFASESKDTKMIYDDDCHHIGKFEVKLDDDQGSNRLNSASTDISFMFGRTELVVRARDKSNGNEVFTNLCLKD